MSQSPKSKRADAPLDKQPDDGLSEHKSGGTHPERHAPSGSGKPTVPSGLDRSGTGGFKGNVAARDEKVSTGPATPSQAGGPGFAKSKDAQRKGGDVHQT